MFKNLLFAAAILMLCAACNSKHAHNYNKAAGDSEAVPLNDWALLPFHKVDSVNPILTPGKGSFIDPILNKKVFWEQKDVFNPAIVNRDGKIFMLYRAQDLTGKPAGTSRIGLAVSDDALHFTRMPEPVFFPANDVQKKLEWEGGCEDPRVVEDSLGTYYMTYTAFDGVKARLLVASSKDLQHWEKFGDVFAKAFKGKYANIWSKSGAIVSTYNEGKIVATKINGKYWMYWGDKQIWAATSLDLINWTPVELPEKEQSSNKSKTDSTLIAGLKIILPTRPGKFDSDLVESGPPAMITNNGILLIYNSRNDQKTGDPSLTTGTYSAGQVLFDKHDPSTIINRMDQSFIKPDKPYEISGQVNRVCFVEGLTGFKNKWYLYYGTADSKIAVACRPQ
jgi:beta-1,2-mannosidase